MGPPKYAIPASAVQQNVPGSTPGVGNPTDASASNPAAVAAAAAAMYYPTGI